MTDACRKKTRAVTKITQRCVELRRFVYVAQCFALCQVLVCTELSACLKGGLHALQSNPADLLVQFTNMPENWTSAWIPFTWTAFCINNPPTHTHHHLLLFQLFKEPTDVQTSNSLKLLWRQRDRDEGAAFCDISAELIDAEVSVLLSPGCSPVFTWLVLRQPKGKDNLPPFMNSSLTSHKVVRGRQEESETHTHKDVWFVLLYQH